MNVNPAWFSTTIVRIKKGKEKVMLEQLIDHVSHQIEVACYVSYNY